MKSQKQRVLEFLQKRTKKGVACWEFTELKQKIMRYGAIIFDLKKDGYKIDCRLGRNKKLKCKTSNYILR